MAITGVRRYVRLLMYRLCLLVQEPTIWIKLWQFKWHDDFIEKPFNLSLTVTKIQALLRRTYDLAVSNNEVIVKNCKLVVDEATLYHEDESVQLSFTELQILNMLFRNEGKYVSRTALIEKCWESENFIDDNTLAVNMTRLRKKLQSIGVVDLIETKKNVGYKVS